MPYDDKLVGYSSWKTPRSTFTDQAVAQTFTMFENWLSGTEDETDTPVVSALKVRFDAEPPRDGSPVIFPMREYHVPGTVYRSITQPMIEGERDAQGRDFPQVIMYGTDTLNTDANGRCFVSLLNCFKYGISAATANVATSASRNQWCVVDMGQTDLNNLCIRIWSATGGGTVLASASATISYIVVGR